MVLALSLSNTDPGGRPRSGNLSKTSGTGSINAKGISNRFPGVQQYASWRLPGDPAPPGDPARMPAPGDPVHMPARWPPLHEDYANEGLGAAAAPHMG